MSRYFLCLTTRSSLFANTFVKALVACWNALQLDTDVVEPNTIAVAGLNRLSAMKPKSSGQICMDSSTMETGLDVGHAKKYYGYRIADSCVIYINVDLNLHITTGY
jgi:hypothetical protein